MIFRFFFIIILAVLLASCSYVQNIRSVDKGQVIDRPLTVLTYNIRFGAGYAGNIGLLRKNNQLNLKPVIEAIRSINPDIVALQEVLGEAQTDEIGRALNMNYAYTPHGINEYNRSWGNATLSKFPISSVNRDGISWGYKNTRANLVTTLKIFDRKLTVVNVHRSPYQKNDKGLRNTMMSIDEITSPLLLIGDFNIGPDDEQHKIFQPRFIDSAEMVNTDSAEFAKFRGTFPGRDRQYFEKRIDYVLVEKDLFTVLDVGLLEEQYWNASDHIGYYSIIKLH